jgi:sugar phosphate isomerase/epimerase
LPVDLQADDETFNRQLAEVEESLALFQELGCSRCETLIAPASSSLPYHENFERHRQRIGVVAETLSKGEMHLGLGLQAAASHREGAEFQFIHKADDLLTLINTTRAENVGLALDTWNWLVGGGSVEQLRGLKGDQIVSVKLSDVPADADLATISEDQRLLPGSGGLVDCALILHVLAENGFKGPIGLAADPSHLTGQTREAIVQNARNVLDQQWSAAGLDSAGRLAPASVEG